MAKPSLSEQIRDVNYAITEYPEYTYSLELHRAVLKMLNSIDEPSLIGSKVPWDEIVSQFSKQAALGKSIISYLDASMFDSQLALKICQNITSIYKSHRLGTKGEQNVENIQKLLHTIDINNSSFLNAILTGDAEWFERYGKRFEVEPAFLIFLFSTPIQPCLEEMARTIPDLLLDQWWRPLCPVCARRPATAWVIKGKRYLRCSFCGSQYLADSFLCVNCGNTDPYSLGFLTLQDFSEFQIDYCEKCRSYIKLIYDHRLKKRIPRGLEDYLTQRLDALAIEAGLHRI